MQCAEATAAAAAASAKYSSLSDDNTKLHEALQLQRSTHATKCEEYARLLADVAALRSDRLRLEAELQDARGKADLFEKQYTNQQQVRCAAWAVLAVRWGG